MHRFAHLSLVSLLALTAPAASALAPQQAAAEREATAPASQPRSEVHQIALRAANPAEVADILRANYRVVATGSVSTGTVTVTATPDVSMPELIEQVRKLDELAQVRAEKVHAAAEAERKILQARQEAELVELQKELQVKSIAVDFPGGTVSEYLDMVSKASGVGNIIVGDDRIKTLKMLAVRVRKVTGTAAIILLESLRFSSDGRSAGVSVQLIPGDPDGIGIEAEPMLVVDIHVNEAEVQTGMPSTEVVDLQAFKSNEPESLPRIIDAVRTAVELQGPSQHFKLSLHEGTGLLFVRGTPNDLRIAIQTVNTIAGTNGK